MYRLIKEELKKWKENPSKKPLIIKGARQIGKTYILKEFGSEEYENIAYFNFDRNESLSSIFENTKDPKRLIDLLSIAGDVTIKPEKTLIIFDEIQECPKALGAIKYFNEEAKEYHLVCAGSLLGIKLSKVSFPVGQVEYLNMYPMTFKEFLLADGEEKLVGYLDSLDKLENIPEIFFDKLSEKLKIFFIVGGMPEAVSAWTQSKDIQLVRKIQKDILDSYEDDFGKHYDDIPNIAAKVSVIWNSIPSQLAKENKKFVYGLAREGARAREYEDAITWLCDAGIVQKVTNTSKAALPLSAYEEIKSFKLYVLDVGLLSRMSGLDSKIILEKNELFEEFKGALSENFVLNMLQGKPWEKVFYHTFDTNEIDYMIQHENEIIPIEVKSGENKKKTSLTKFNSLNDNKLSIRFSLRNLEHDGKILNIPLFMVEFAENLI